MDHVERFLQSLTQTQQKTVELLAKLQGHGSAKEFVAASTAGDAPAVAGRNFMMRNKSALATAAQKTEESRPGAQINKSITEKVDTISGALETATKGAAKSNFSGIIKAGDLAQKYGIDNVGGMDVSKGLTLARAASGDPTAIVQTAMMAEQNKEQKNAATMAHLKAGVASDSPFAAAGHSLRAGGEQLDKAIDPVGIGYGKAAAAPVRFAAGLIESVDKLKTWTNELHQANVQFSQFSGAMSAVQARQEVRDIDLSRRKGDALAETAEGNAESKARLEKAMAPWEVAWGKVRNKWGEWASNAGSWALENVTPDFIKNQMGAEDTPMDMEELVSQGNTERWYEKYGRPERFGAKR